MYVYLYIYMCMCICICIYIFIYINAVKFMPLPNPLDYMKGANISAFFIVNCNSSISFNRNICFF